jgi:hypothetical protein
VIDPYGCTHCGEAKNVHGNRWHRAAGLHQWEKPTNQQMKDRMQARRATKEQR